MENTLYKFKEIENKRWGIYLQDRLLATVGSYEICQSLKEYLSNNLSEKDALRSSIAYKNAISKYLTVN